MPDQRPKPSDQPCGVCGQLHPGKECHTLLEAIGKADGTMDLAPLHGVPDRMLGLTLGSYELVSVLGSGSFGVVYRAIHKETGEAVALKLMHENLVSNGEVVRRFLGEARATLLVQHPNVVQVKTIDAVERNRYFIVLELLQGETLESRCERGPIPFVEAAPLLRQLCDAVGAAHTVGIVHRDLKPENIYLERQGDRQVIKVMDFGVARRAHLSQGETRTRSGQVMGTPQYLSPEQSLGLEVDLRTDVYSLGVIMFRMLTGRLPFDQINVTELIVAHRISKPPAPTSVLSSLPKELDGLVLKALQKNPNDRYQTMEQYEAAIASVEAALLAAGMAAPAPALQLLAALEGTPADAHYQLLGVREGADEGAIMMAAATVLKRLGQAREEADPELLPRLEAATQRVDEVQELLVDPARRAAWDSERGNFLGVARAISSGLDLEVLTKLRTFYLATRGHLLLLPPVPELPPDATPAQAEAVAAELARRLRQDPLNLELQKRYWALRDAHRQRGTTGVGSAVPSGT